MRDLDPGLLDRPIDVVGSDAASLRDLVRAGPVLLVVLRHTG